MKKSKGKRKVSLKTLKEMGIVPIKNKDNVFTFFATVGGRFIAKTLFIYPDSKLEAVAYELFIAGISTGVEEGKIAKANEIKDILNIKDSELKN